MEVDERKRGSEQSQVRVGGGLDKVGGSEEGMRDGQRLSFLEDLEIVG